MIGQFFLYYIATQASADDQWECRTLYDSSWTTLRWPMRRYWVYEYRSKLSQEANQMPISLQKTMIHNGQSCKLTPVILWRRTTHDARNAWRNKTSTQYVLFVISIKLSRDASSQTDYCSIIWESSAVFIGQSRRSRPLALSMYVINGSPVFIASFTHPRAWSMILPRSGFSIEWLHVSRTRGKR